VEKLPSSLRGHLLVASPDLTDPNFHRSVILMIDHDDQGALGLVLNRPLKKTIGEIWHQIHDGEKLGSKAPVHWGGPVAGPLVAVHQLEECAEVEIIPGIYFTTDKIRVGQAIKQAAKKLRFYVGCAGWSAGQLEEEIAEGAWGILPARSIHVVESPENLWQRVGDELTLGVMYSKLGAPPLPEDPEMN
jgi:putative transcriptional regulator